MKAILMTFFLAPLMLLSQTPAELINDMKDGVILVRLMTREKAIQALNDAGQPERAQAVIEDQKEENLEITKAFEENFDFCPVMFFYSSCSENIRDREFQGCLMNADLEPVPDSDILSIDKFFISEFGNVEPSDEKFRSLNSLEQDEEGNFEIRENYYGDTEIGAAALVIRDASFKQLRDPFPFHVRTKEGLPWKKSKAKTVAKMNKNLHSFLDNPG